MKSTTKLMLTAAIAIFIGLPLSKSNLFAGNSKSNAPAKVEMCHMMPNGKSSTIMVSPSAVAAHLAHGDAIGACP